MVGLFKIFILLSLLKSYTFSHPWSTRVVSSRLGLVRGYIFNPPKYSSSGSGVEVFLALPYASPPVGSLRFMPPVSGTPWTGTKMNQSPPPVCPQLLPSITNETESLEVMPKGQLALLRRLLPFLTNQSEDCLYLNLYVPISVSLEKVNGLLPVLVFVHGNDYSYGAGYPYDPSMLVSYGQVIVVTMNYRLGILGFLNANSDGYFKSPANFALLDQIAALHWVQENIEFFGGDRSNVTLMGHGKGGIFVNFLMISSAVPTGLLFHRVILSSGSALSPTAVGSIGLSNGKELAKRFSISLKCPTEPPSIMLNCLRQAPLEDILESDLWSSFGPSEDGITIEEGLKESVLRDKLSHYPLLFGVTKVEMLPNLSEHDALFGIESERRREILKGFIESHFSVHRNEILAAAIHEYTEWERPVQHPISVRDETLDALADAQVVAPLVKTGDFHSQSNSKSFFYVFEYQSKGSDFQQRLGCVHGEDLHYIFGVPLFFFASESSSSNVELESYNDSSEHTLGFFSGNFTRNEVGLSQTVMQFWTNFIKTGNPNDAVGESESGGSPGGSRLTNDKSMSKSKVIEWAHYDPMYKKYLSLDMKPRVRTHYRAHKLSFWLHLVPDLMRNGYGSPPSHHSIPNLHEIESGNSSATPPPPTIQLVGPPLWEHSSSDKRKSHYFTGNLSQEGGATGSVTHGGVNEDGYQIYSTALSVTIAIGCSLLILNILIFAAFYYQRDKRRNEGQIAQYSEGSSSGLSYHHHPSASALSQYETHHHSSTPPPSFHSSTLHRSENGECCSGIEMRNESQMPNICGELSHSNDPSSALSLLSPKQQQEFYVRSSSSSTPVSRGPKNSYDMPDAILAAAMMSLSGSPHEVGTTGRGRRGSLTTRESFGCYEGSRTLPRPPKRSTPSVKFNCSEIEESGNLGTNCGSMGEAIRINTFSKAPPSVLKPSLKKSSNYTGIQGSNGKSGGTDELKV